MRIDCSVLNSLFSRASLWPPDGCWGHMIRNSEKFLIEHKKTGMLMVLVPEGKFLTSTGGGTSFKVELAAYYVAVHPVTNAQYARFVGETGHRKPELAEFGKAVWNNGTYPPEKANHPVVCVSWEDATAYCRWAELRLPTELEWEKAARGLDGRIYPWGHGWDERRCRNEKNKAGERTAGVWTYGLGGSPFGGLHFSGNVWEWCADRIKEDVEKSYRLGDLISPPTSQSRILRGGGWDLINPNQFSASRRRQAHPGYGRDYYGFRCVLGLSDSP